MNVKNYKTIICIAAAVAFLGAAVFCGFKIYSHYQQIDEQTEAFAEIAEVVENAEPEEEPPRAECSPAGQHLQSSTQSPLAAWMLPLPKDRTRP